MWTPKPGARRARTMRFECSPVTCSPTMLELARLQYHSSLITAPPSASALFCLRISTNFALSECTGRAISASASAALSFVMVSVPWLAIQSRSNTSSAFCVQRIFDWFGGCPSPHSPAPSRARLVAGAMAYSVPPGWTVTPRNPRGEAYRCKNSKGGRGTSVLSFDCAHACRCVPVSQTAGARLALAPEG